MNKTHFTTLIALLIVVFSYSQTFNISYRSAVELGNINDSRIKEASGISPSYNYPGAFWIHNDSGDGPNIFLIDSTGKTLTNGSLLDVNSRDWEDMASFKLNGKSYLLIANTGDNPVNKSEYWLYIIEEPEYSRKGNAKGSYNVLRKITYQYDDGSKDCESVAVDVREMKIILVSKSGDKQGDRVVYEIPLSVEPGNITTTAKRIAGFAMDATTAMDISNDGQRAVVLTYKNAYEFTRYYGETWADAFAGKPREIHMPERPGGEAIAYGLNATDLYSVREGASSPVWFLQGIVDAGAVFQVDMFEVNDMVGKEMWLNIQGLQQPITMTDTDDDKIFACKVNLPLDSTYNYFFSYQNGADSLTDINKESVPHTCSAIDGYREIFIEQQNQMQKAVMFGGCYTRPSYVTLKVDLVKVNDLESNGLVGLYLPYEDTILAMQKADTSNIYQLMVSGNKAQSLFYKFCYQNGVNPETNLVYENIPVECATNDDLRSFDFREELMELQAVVFGTCQEALPDGTDITDLDGVKIVGSNDELPWEGPENGGGSPDDQKADKLIDNNNDTKYLVRAIDSWVELVLPNLTKLTAYTITSGGDVPSRDPRSWKLQGWNNDSNQWELIHEVQGNPEWQNRLSRKSWEFANEKWYGKYRLHITEINGNTQQLMQMAELQLFGEVGDDLQWSSIATLQSLAIEGAELSPAFSANNFNYNVELPYGTVSLKISAIPTDDKSKVEGVGTFILALLSETPQVTVFAEDGITKNTYTVNYTVVSENVSIGANETKVKIYPIPSNGELYIDIKNTHKLQVSIFDSLGAKVYENQLNNSMNKLNLSHLKTGFYNVQLFSEGKLSSHKLYINK